MWNLMLRDRHTCPPKTGSADGDEESGDGFLAAPQFLEALADQLAARQCVEIHGGILARGAATGSAPAGKELGRYKGWGPCDTWEYT